MVSFCTASNLAYNGQIGSVSFRLVAKMEIVNQRAHILMQRAAAPNVAVVVVAD